MNFVSYGNWLHSDYEMKKALLLGLIIFKLLGFSWSFWHRANLNRFSAQIVSLRQPLSLSSFRGYLKGLIKREVDKNQHFVTRFPPEPNGCLHIGHAKSILINFGLAREFGGKTIMRFDDTNPSNNYNEFVDSILDDVRWLVPVRPACSDAGSESKEVPWDGPVRFASDYFDKFFQFAEYLVQQGLAYIDDLTPGKARRRRRRRRMNWDNISKRSSKK